MLVNLQPSQQVVDDGPPVTPTIASFIERAAALIDIDRDASEQSLRLAVALLRARRRLSVPRETPPPQGQLAAWQVKRIFAHVEENLGSRLPLSLSQRQNTARRSFTRDS
jgi:hypothetical protein